MLEFELSYKALRWEIEGEKDLKRDEKKNSSETMEIITRIGDQAREKENYQIKFTSDE